MVNKSLRKPIFIIVLILVLSVTDIVISAKSSSVELSRDMEFINKWEGEAHDFNYYTDDNNAAKEHVNDNNASKGVMNYSNDSKEATIKVNEKNADAVYALADDILSVIITPDMIPMERARRIHTWIRKNIKYTAGATKDDVINGAYFGLRDRHGDCFAFYAISEILLTRAGIENMRVNQSGETPHHFWNLIHVAEGWYHFDACPPPEYADTFMFTGKQAEEYTELFESVPDYYVYDKSLYPTVVGDISFRDNNLDNLLGENARSVIEALGKPVSYFEAPSCVFKGLDKIYTYSGIELYTYPINGIDYLSSVILTDDSVSTGRGVRLGMKQDDVISAYGDAYVQEFGLISYTMGKYSLSFLIENGLIAAITYNFL